MPVELERLVLQAVLDLVVQQAATLAPDLDAGVTLVGEGLHGVVSASTTARAREFERVQHAVDQSPGIVAATDDAQVLADDLAADLRFPALAAHAKDLRTGAAFSFPLRHSGSGPLGSLTLSRRVTGALAPEVRACAQELADMAAAHLPSARARAEALSVSDAFRESSLHDALTGLANRVLLQQRLEHAAARASRSHGTVAVLFADLDRFKGVNDTYGHAVGDGLLVAVAERLRTLVRPGDTLARVSGDEFVFLCEDLLDVADGQSLADRVSAAFSRPFVVDALVLHSSASVGIAYAGPGEAVTTALIVNADMAMYQAKRQGAGVPKVIDLRDAQDAHDRTRLQQDLHGAVAREELTLVYQPIVRSGDGRTTGVEALLRWTHPVLGPVPAASVVAMAEEGGLIGRLGAWVLQNSCAARGRWLAGHPDDALTLSVNVSALQLMGAGFAQAVTDVLAATGTAPSALVLEVTEGLLIDDTERALVVLRELKRLGVRLALDDFGTGYCSLSYLRRFPVDIVKIDQQFVADIGLDPAGVAIVSAVTTLAHVLGMEVTAEGVETAEQRAEVASLGCDHAQGFWYARPMSADSVSVHLDRQGALRGSGPQRPPTAGGVLEPR